MTEILTSYACGTWTAPAADTSGTAQPSVRTICDPATGTALAGVPSRRW